MSRQRTGGGQKGLTGVVDQEHRQAVQRIMQSGQRTAQTSGPEGHAVWLKDCTDQRTRGSCSLVKGLHRQAVQRVMQSG